MLPFFSYLSVYNEVNPHSIASSNFSRSSLTVCNHSERSGFSLGCIYLKLLLPLLCSAMNGISFELNFDLYERGKSFGTRSFLIPKSGLYTNGEVTGLIPYILVKVSLGNIWSTRARDIRVCVSMNITVFEGTVYFLLIVCRLDMQPSCLQTAGKNQLQQRVISQHYAS